MARRHSFEVRKRAFLIWQKAGYNPWKKAETAVVKKDKSGAGDFYKGAFDNIPFLNNDAKRTFQHLMLRPGYMIRDYIRGAHERYLAPLTALIVFYAFFALVSSVLQPIQHKDKLPDRISIESEESPNQAERMTGTVAEIVRKGYLYLHLDQYPEAVTTQREAALAALEGTLRSQGIPLFLSEFLILWLAMGLSLHRFRFSASAYAVAAAYVLCQFSFFMLFAVLLTWGRSTSINVLLMLFLLMLDYRQWLGLSWRKSFWRALWTGACYGMVYGALLLLISAVVLVIAFVRA